MKTQYKLLDLSLFDTSSFGSFGIYVLAEDRYGFCHKHERLECAFC